ncbi:thioredoxin domain-containing protein [Nocardioides sp. 616]|uniref:DsbA family protein n=1 Tax=Nocardioides sp. 616 TaxID=2268090 RepID=UPI000CE4EDB2|nr:thioredoxin domain-containing protein [Nocardioides sp. 616]
MAKNTPKKNSPGARAEEREAAAAKRAGRQDRKERAAAALAARQKARKRKERLSIAAVVVAVLLVIGGITLWQMNESDKRADAEPPANAVDDYALAVGDPEAPHTVEIYEDFLCPACGVFEGLSNETLAKAAEDGKVYVKYLPFELLSQYGDYSKEAANAFAVVLDTSGPEVAKKFHDELFADQPSESGGQPDTDWLVKKAVEAGAEESEVRPGIEDMKFEYWVDNATKNAEEAKVQGTPTIRLDGEDVAGADYNEVLANIMSAIG